MNAGAAVVEQAELIKWADALDELRCDRYKALQMARECRHPDALWLVSLLPGEGWSAERMREIMLQQGEDPRALFVAADLLPERDMPLLRRAAEMGYAPAQGVMSQELYGDGNRSAEVVEWARKAAAQGERRGLYYLMCCDAALPRGEKAQLLKRSAELSFPSGLYQYGMDTFGEREWERYHWMGKAVQRNHGVFGFKSSVLELLPSFEKGELARVLHTAALVVREGLNATGRLLFGENFLTLEQAAGLQRVLELHDALLQRARRAIACWSMAGRRLGVVKDMRVMIAKLVWEEPWQWGETEQVDKKARLA
jgi:hypothetical protein